MFGINDMTKNKMKYFYDEYTMVNSLTTSETEMSLVIRLVAPGQDKEKMKIRLVNRKLSISIPESRVKTFNIPDDIDLTDIKAEYVDGILKVTLAKKPLEKREIEIK